MRLLVLGEPTAREHLARDLERLDQVEVVDCDPALGDCVMDVRLEGARFDAFFFVGFDDPVTRGGLPVVAERAVLIPLVQKAPDPAHDGYLFRLPKAIGYRDEEERSVVLSTVPQAASVASYLVGAPGADIDMLSVLAKRATDGDWQWDAFVDHVSREIAEHEPRS